MKLRHLLVGFFACLAFIACDRDDDSQVSIDSGKGEETFLPIGDITVHPLGDALMMSYTSQYEWKLDYDGKGDWINISPASGKAGTTRIKIVVDPNLDQSRYAVIKFSNGGRVLDSFIATQYEAILDVTIDKAPQDDEDADIHEYKTDGAEKIKFDWKKSREGADFRVSSNIEWEIDIDDEVHYLLKDGNEDVLSRKYGSVADNPKDFPFGLHARNHNLSDNDTLRREITVSPRKVNKDGEEDSLPEEVVDSLTRTIEVTQEFLIFYLEGNDLEKNEENSDTYDFGRAFTELGNDYLSKYKEADMAPGEQIFYLVYEEGKVDFSEGSWGALQAGSQTELENGDVLKCLSEGSVMKKLQSAKEDETEKERKCVRKEMCLAVPDPNPNKLPEDSDSAAPTPKSVPLPLSVGEDVVSTITLNYSQNLYELFLSRDGGTFSNKGGEGDKMQVTVDTKGPWKLESSGEWLMMTDNGHGRGKIEIYAPDQNLSFKEKTASLTLSTNFSSEDPGIKDVNQPKFSQEEFVFQPTSYLPTENISRLDRKEYQITLETSGPWTLKTTSEDNEYWLDVIAKSSDSQEVELTDGVLKAPAAGEWTITLQANHTNEDEDARTMDIEITSDLHEGLQETNAEKKFNMTQDPYRFVVSKDGKSIKDERVPISAYLPEEYKFKIECGGPWRIVDTPEWVTVNGGSEGDGTEYIDLSIKTEDNTGEKWDESREGNIVVRSYRSHMSLPADSDAEGYEDIEFTLDQDAFKFDVNVSPEYSVSAIDNQKRYFDITSTAGAGWTISCDDWVKPQTEDGTGNGNMQSLYFSLEENGYLSERTAQVTVSSDVVDKSVPFYIHQGAYRFDNTPVDFDEFAELSQPAVNFEVDCLGPWEIKDCPEWIYYHIGDVVDGKQTVIVEPEDNYGGIRSGEFTVYSKVGRIEHKKKITVKQRDFVWKLKEGPASVSHESLQKDDYVLKFTSSGKWKAEVQNDIEECPITLSPARGDGGRDIEETVSFTVPENYRQELRKAKIVITSLEDDSKTQSVDVSQKAYEFSLGKAPEEECAVLGDSFTVPVTCTGEWEVELTDDEKEFLEVSPMSGTGGGELTVKLGPNYLPQARKGSIKVRTTDPSQLSRSIDFAQQKYIFGLADVPSTGVAAHAQSIEFNVNCSGNWKVELDADAQQFVTVESGASGKGNGKISVALPMNKAASERRGKIIVSSTDNEDLREELTVSQAGYVFRLDKDSKTVAILGETFNVGVTCTGSWRVSEKSDFLVIPEDKMSGKGDGKIPVTAALNNASSPRTGVITFVSEDNASFTKTVTVSQAGYVWDSEPVDRTVAILGETFNVGVTCTGSWRVDLDENAKKFLTVKETSGSGNKSISVTAALNSTSSPRTGVITVVSEDNPSFTKKVTVSQAGYVWDVTYDSMQNVPAAGGKYEVDVKCTGSWKVNLDDNAKKFLTVDKTSGNGDGKLTLTVQSNKKHAYEGAEATSDRTGKVTISTTDGSGKTTSITIKQAGDK